MKVVWGWKLDICKMKWLCMWLHIQSDITIQFRHWYIGINLTLSLIEKYTYNGISWINTSFSLSLKEQGIQAKHATSAVESISQILIYSIVNEKILSSRLYRVYVQHVAICILQYPLYACMRMSDRNWE